ncbi:hypothetical protein D3C86_2029720 [compost metagenome]
MAGIAGGDAAALDHRLEVDQVFQAGLRTVAFIAGEGDLFQARLASGFVDHLPQAGDRDDFAIEQAGPLRRSGS